MDSNDESTAELKVIYVGNLELAMLGKLDEVKNEFWKRRPLNELRIHTNKHNSHVSSTYLFLTQADSILFGELLKERNINFFYHLESKFDEMATLGMSNDEKKEYFSTKVF